MFLAALSQGHYYLLEELRSFLFKLKQTRNLPFLALAASMHIALSTEGTILVLFAALLGLGWKRGGGSY